MNKKIPKKYLPKSLSSKDKKTIGRELKKSKKQYKNKKYHTRKQVKSFKSKVSQHIINARKIYNINDIKPSKEFAKKTGCSVDALEQIVKKGMGAYYSSGSRPNQSPHSWGIARLASAVTGGKSSIVDFHIIKKGCDKKKKAYKLAIKTKKKTKNKIRKTAKTRLI